MPSSNKLYEVANYTSIHQVRKQRRGFSQWIHQSVEFKIRTDVSLNYDDVESVLVEILFENRKNTIFNVLYKQLKGQIEPFKNSNKQFHVAGNSMFLIMKYMKK